MKASLAAGGVLLAGCETRAPAETDASDTASGRIMTDEGARHDRTWMAFAASEDIWGSDLVPAVKRNLAEIARTIATFEPVSMLVSTADMPTARELIGTADVELVTAEIDDLWVRDTGPVFVTGATPAGVDFNFNGWGGKQQFALDGQVASFVTARSGRETVHTDLILEGGALEVDGAGTAIVTESCVLNDNRNPGWSKQDVEAELRDLLGIEKVIWLPGVAGKDITDGHTDFYARFAAPGVVVAGLDSDPSSFDFDVTRRHLDILRDATDARGTALQVEVLEAPSSVRTEFVNDDFAAGYVNFYVCNGAVIAPQFGAADTDAAARATLERLFPGRAIVQIDIDAIAAGGGGIHCATMQQPA